MYKTLYFYKLNIKKLMTTDYLSETSFYNLFNERFCQNDIKINKDNYTWGEYKSCLLDDSVVVDILEHTPHYLFGTIGCTKNENRLRRIRNIKDLSYDKLKLEDDTILEDYTFFYLDYQTGIISVLNTKGAPDIKNLKRLLFYFPELDAEMYAIRNNDIQGKLSKIQEVGAVSLKFASPPMKILGKGTNISIIDKLNNSGYDGCEIIFHMNRKNEQRKHPQNILNQIFETYELVNTPGNEYNLEKLSLIATPEDEKQQTLNLLELLFTKGVHLKIDDNFSEKSILETLIMTYNILKEDLLKNVSLHIK